MEREKQETTPQKSKKSLIRMKADLRDSKVKRERRLRASDAE